MNGLPAVAPNMESDPSELSIVIPAYNEHETVDLVIERVLASPFEPHVVVVDDGSTDDTFEVARRNATYVLRHVLNRGQGAALQTGIEIHAFFPTIFGLPLAALLLAYALLIAIPFVPGVELGLTLMMVEGAVVAPFIWAATLMGLGLAFAGGLGAEELAQQPDGILVA